VFRLQEMKIPTVMSSRILVLQTRLIVAQLTRVVLGNRVAILVVQIMNTVKSLMTVKVLDLTKENMITCCSFSVTCIARYIHSITMRTCKLTSGH